MEYISIPFGYVMKFCYSILSNYGLSIILFTFFTKVILFPVSLWTHKNSVNLLRIQPQINFIKAKYFGNKDRISDEEMALYKKEKYHPFANLIPMFLQIFLLMCVIEIIYKPLTFVLSMDKGTVDIIVNTIADALNLDKQSNSIQLSVIQEIKNGFTINGVDLSSIKSLDLKFLCFDLSAVPSKSKGIMLLVPLLAGLSSLALCLFQNKMNPLQAEQAKLEKLLTNVLSVGISLFLGGFVPVGIGLYWIFSNLFTMLQQVILNIVIKPSKYVDYKLLQESRDALESVSSASKSRRFKLTPEEKKKEKQDYKRFFSVANKHLVFYSENGGFYKYFKKTIEYLLENSNVIIHYVTSDYNDSVFELEKKHKNLRAYFIGEKKLISLFMKLDADIVVMTMPDLDNYHLKRSYVRNDIEYIYMFHGALSVHMVNGINYFTNYDTVFCVGDYQIDELRKQEEIYNQKHKKLVKCGYGQLENLYERYCEMNIRKNEKPKILIAPSWQEDNILDSCLDKIIGELVGKGFSIVVRPHPEYKKRYSQRLEAIVNRYSGKYNDLNFELDFSDNSSLYNSDIIISDWSGAAIEFSFATLKPCVFINTPAKVYNPEYTRLGIEPMEITMRDVIGKSFDVDKLDGLSNSIEKILENLDYYSKIILDTRDKYIANFGKSGEISGRYIINALIEKQRKNKENIND